ncbi:acetylcholinesterase [Rhipicephalus sanguineus]|uniref:acetylcholinesterase n=1 Tax=Rhipicephalus sanguineus TaxID=34632 RepID=UPI001894FBBB|nr:acetylcholinesterase [Rhipicephalus sanguineus]
MTAVAALVFLLALASRAAAFDVETVTSLGIVGGSRFDVLDRTLEVYRGIPYAQPPLGPLRFRPPEPLQSWEGIVDATNRKIGCAQTLFNEVLTTGVELTEDCLHLNIWAPAERGQLPVPVLVSFHGGGFSYGSANTDVFDGAALAAKTGLVVVAPNYRLDILGFLDANSTEAPGNVGLMDQNMALKWVRDHIHHFGGDPSQVTIFGISAGGMSAHSHVLSPMSRGLYKRACLMSGTLNSPDFVEHVNDSISKGNIVARVVGCADDTTTLASNPESVVACLRTKTTNELLQAAAESFKTKIFTFLPTYPNQFMPKEPAVAVKEGSFNQADLIVGVTTDEGAVALLYPPRQELWGEMIEVMDDEFLNKSLREITFTWLKGNSTYNLEAYTAEARDKISLRRAYVDFISDRTFVCPMHYTAEGHSEGGQPVHSLVFSYRSAKSPLPAWMGAPHGEDVSYLYGAPLVHPEKYDARDASMSEALMNVLSTFARTGMPQLPEEKLWPTYTKHNPISVLFDKDNIAVVTGFRRQFCDAWRTNE